MSGRHPPRAPSPPVLISEVAAVDSFAASCQKGREVVAPRVAAAVVAAEAVGSDFLSALAAFPECRMPPLRDSQSSVLIP